MRARESRRAGNQAANEIATGIGFSTAIMPSHGGVRPYSTGAPAYYRAGWAPIPVNGKYPPVTGYTGAAGAVPSFADIQAWTEDPKYGAWNIGVRLPKHVIGIDVDCYEGKPGEATIAAWEAKGGALPPTPFSTSRADGSRIRFYRVPTDREWISEGHEGSGVEIIRHSHRYAIVWPSVHPRTGSTYYWYDGQGTQLDDPPQLGALAALPGPWLNWLTKPTTKAAPPDRTAVGGKHTGPIPHSSRHASLVALAGYLRRIDLPYELAVPVMLWRLRDCAQPPRAPYPVTQGEAIEKLRDIYTRYSPGGVPRGVAS